MAWDEWIRTVEIEPALHAADAARIIDQVEILLRAGARVFHFDVGEGGGRSVLRAVAPAIHRAGGAIDIHLTFDAPERELEDVRTAGGDSVTLQYELCADHSRQAERARASGFQGVGLAVAPETTAEAVLLVAGAFDVVSLATADLQPGSLERLQTLRNLLPERIHLQADGGIDHDNVRSVYDAGADLFVADSSIFGREDLPRNYRRLVQLLA